MPRGRTPVSAPRPEGERPRRLRQPRLAEMVAATLRDDILTRRLKEGDILPRQEDLFEEFQVSLPAVREAMRILETEGLISVRRGNVGGAVVHLPSAESTARMISMVLQVRDTSLGDVSGALLHLEPICAGLCASRDDRAEEVVPHLRAALDAQVENFDDVTNWTPLARRFHEAMVEHCGSESMKVVIGSLETIWSAHESTVWAETAMVDRAQEAPDSPTAATTLRAAMRDHERILAAIEAGNSERAIQLAAAHMTATRSHTLASSATDRINANLLYPGDRPSR